MPLIGVTRTMNREIFRNDESGAVAAFMAILLPVMMAIMALVIDSGTLYIRHAEIHFLAQQSANSGLLAFGKILEQKAAQSKASLCIVVPPASPPPICDSDNQFDFLSNNDIYQLVNSSTNQNNIKNNASQFAQTYDPQAKIKNTDVESFLGESFLLGNRKLNLRVTIEEDVDRFFSTLLPGDSLIKIEAVSTLTLE